MSNVLPWPSPDPDPHITPEEADQKHTSHLRIAYRLAHTYENRLLHVHGIGWHAWDGQRWAEDPSSGAAYRALAEILREAWPAAQTDKELKADIEKSQSAAGMAGVLAIASRLETFDATVDHLDQDHNLLNTQNGTIELDTLTLRPADPKDRITKVCGGNYYPDAHSTNWDTYLERVLPDPETRAFLQRYTGLGLLGKVREHALAILTGTGRNGKGVFYGAVATALGDYAITAEPDLFMAREGAHPTGEMDLRGIRWVVVSESEQGRRLAEASVKRLTGGDVIKARRMRQDFVQFAPSHTAVLVTNHLPKVRGDDPAIWARLRVVPFDVVIPKEEQDPDLSDKLDEDADAVLAWAVRGWVAYQEQGLAEPEAVRVATADYHADSDPVTRFVNDACLTGAGYQASVSDIWDAWSMWRLDEGAEELSKRAFGEALDRRGYATRRGTGGRRMRVGLGLTSDQDEDRW